MIYHFLYIFLICCHVIPISPSPSSFVLNSLQLQPSLDFSSYYYQFIDASTVENSLFNDKASDRRSFGGISKEPINDIIDSDDDSDIDEPIVARSYINEDDEDYEKDEESSDENDKHENNNGGDDDNGDSSSPNNNNNPSSYRFTTKTLNTDSNKDAMEVEVKLPTVETATVTLSSRIAQVWSEFIESSPTEAQLQRIIAGQIDKSEPYESISGSLSTSPASASTVMKAIALRANGTDHASFHRQLLAQFLSPLSRGDQRALWLDPELVLNLRGQLILATSGDGSRVGENDTKNISGSSSLLLKPQPQYRRGLRLSCPSGTCTMVKAVITALTQSVGADLAIINRRTLESVRHRVSRRFDIPLDILTMEVLVESLFQRLHQSQRRSVVCLQDEMNWFVHQPGVARQLREELQRSASRVFLLQVDPDAPLVSGYSPSEARVKQQGPTVASLTAQDQPTGGGGSPNQFSFPGFSFPPSPPPSAGSKSASSPFRPSPSSQIPSAATAGINNNMPSSNSRNSNNMMPQPIGQSFQILIKNGTATINPIPSIVPNGVSPQNGMNPFGFPSGMMMPMSPQGQGSLNMGGQMPNPPEALMRAITEHRLKRQQEGRGGDDNGDMGMTAEDMKVFMSDATNRAAMQEFLESVMKMAQSQMPPGALSGNNDDGSTDDESSQPMVEVKVHMMSVPMMLPPGMNMNNLPPHLIQQLQQQAQQQAQQLAAQQPQQQSSAAVTSATGAGAKSKKQQLSPRFPGIFLKNNAATTNTAIAKDNTTNDSGNDKNATETASPTTTAADKTVINKKKGLGKATDIVREKLKLSTSIPTVTASSPSPARTRISSMEAARELERLTSPSLFPDLVITPPRDHSLRVLWERMADEEMGHKVARLNRRLLEREVKRTGTKLRHLPSPSSSSTMTSAGATNEGVQLPLRSTKSVLYSATLTDVLSRRVLLPDEVVRSVQSATLFQAGLGHSHSSHGHTQLQSSTTTNTDPIEAVAVTNNQQKKQQDQSSDESSTMMEVSLWAMDAGICSAIGLPVPRLGRSATRSLEDLFASITDKHERALLGNVISPAEIGVSYDMIGGLTDVKQALQQCITYPLKYPRLYQEGVAAEGIKGVLLFGPPGTGKTMLAKAVATEGGATFLSVDPSTIENKWLGESEKNARAVFTLARKLAPCVIYLDEVDSLLSSREGGDDSSHGTLTSVKTTLMQEWDGLRTTKDRVVVIASTNRPFDLDEAVLRRLPRRILVDLPDQQTREEILSVTLSGNRLAPDVNLTKIAMQLEGYTGSDVKEVCREAVVRVCHERARIEEGLAQAQVPVSNAPSTDSFATSDSSLKTEENDLEDMDSDAPLRPVNAADFTIAMRKLKASVSETSREAERVAEWNIRFGEVKKGSGGRRAADRARQQLNMYV